MEIVSASNKMSLLGDNCADNNDMILRISWWATAVALFLGIRWPLCLLLLDKRPRQSKSVKEVVLRVERLLLLLLQLLPPQDDVSVVIAWWNAVAKWPLFESSTMENAMSMEGDPRGDIREGVVSIMSSLVVFFSLTLSRCCSTRVVNLQQNCAALNAN